MGMVIDRMYGASNSNRKTSPVLYILNLSRHLIAGHKHRHCNVFLNLLQHEVFSGDGQDKMHLSEEEFGNNYLVH